MDCRKRSSLSIGVLRLIKRVRGMFVNNSSAVSLFLRMCVNRSIFIFVLPLLNSLHVSPDLLLRAREQALGPELLSPRIAPSLPVADYTATATDRLVLFQTPPPARQLDLQCRRVRSADHDSTRCSLPAKSSALVLFLPATADRSRYRPPD